MADNENEDLDDLEPAPGLRTDEKGKQTHDLELRPLTDKSVACAQTCCDQMARIEVNGMPLCDACLQTKLGPTKIYIGRSAPIPDTGKPCV
jgi:hypothetical protein